MSLRWPLTRRRSASASQPQASSSQQPQRRSSGFGTASSPATAPAPAPATQPRRTSNAALETLRGRVRGHSSASVSGANGVSRPAYSGGTRSAPAIHLLSHTEEGASGSRSNTPPPYAHHSLYRSPLPNPMALDDRPRVPPPIYLRSSNNQPQSKLGSLSIHVPGW